MHRPAVREDDFLTWAFSPYVYLILLALQGVEPPRLYKEVLVEAPASAAPVQHGARVRARCGRCVRCMPLRITAAIRDSKLSLEQSVLHGPKEPLELDSFEFHRLRKLEA